MIKAIKGNNFSGKTHYLKCLSEFPTYEVQTIINANKVLHKDTRKSIYVNTIPENNFTGIFDTVSDELFRLIPDNASTILLELIKNTGIDKLYQQNPYHLSGGEKALVSIIASAIENPKILAIDNVFEQLDQTNKSIVLHTLNKIHIPEIVFCDNRLNEIDHRNYSIELYNKIDEKMSHKLKLKTICNTHLNLDKKHSKNTLEIASLDFSFPKKKLFEKFSYKFNSENIYQLAGRNGAGKSTLSKILTGIIKPKKNSKFLFNDRIITPFLNPGKLIGYCAQQPDEQLFESSVKNELQIQSKPTSYQEQILKTFGLDQILSQHPFDLPLATRKKLSIAATLSIERPVYILDEPTLYLDDKNVAELITVIEKLSKAGRIIILISHSKSFINAIKKLTIVNI